METKKILTQGMLSVSMSRVSDTIRNHRSETYQKMFGYHIYMPSPNAVMQYFKSLDLVEAECMVEA